MSVLYELRDAEQRVIARLKDLEPAVAEYRELEQVAERLGLREASNGGPSAPAAAPGPRRRRARRAAKPSDDANATSARAKPTQRDTAARGQREQQLLE